MKHLPYFLTGTVMLFLLTNASAQSKKATNRFAGLDTAFNRVLKDWHAAGFAVAVVEKNQVVYAKGFGYKDYDNKLPVTANTLFAIGSCTKAFTASLLGMLNKDGKVNFDKPVHTYLPELKLYNDALTDKITLRDMMSHRTGLPRHDLSWYYFTTASRDSLLQRMAYMEPSAELRENWQYNNFMFMLQGVVAEKISGKSWEHNIRQKIFLPLGMTGSDVSIDELLKSPDAAFGYDTRKDSIIHKMDYYHIDAMGPAGGINSSVADMAKWVTAWINGGIVNRKEIFPASYLSEAISSQMVVGAGLPDKENPELHLSNYGFGWLISSYRGHYRVQHGGNIDGFSASTSFFPSDSIGIIVLCNQNNSTVPSVIRNILSDRLLHLKNIDWETDLKRAADKANTEGKEAEKVKTSVQKTGTHPSHQLKDYEGVYTNKGYGSFEVLVQNDSLFAQLSNRLLWLRHYHYDVFEPIEKDSKEGYDTTDHGTPMQFNMNITGDIENISVTFESTVNPLVFVKTLKAKNISKDSLQQYAGEYTLGGIIAKISVKGESNLFLFVPGQPEYELTAVGNNKFSIKNLNGYTLQFNRDEKGIIAEVLFIQPNGTFKATRKK